jgi:DNA polymerase III subunit alpha
MTFKRAFKESPELKKENANSPNPLIAKTLRLQKHWKVQCARPGCMPAASDQPQSAYRPHPLMPSKGRRKPAHNTIRRALCGDIGLLKMDFLGLKTLSIIKETLENIKLSKGIDIDIDAIPFE